MNEQKEKPRWAELVRDVILIGGAVLVGERLNMKGHFLKALKLLADNDEDRGNVPSMLWALCQERRPADYVFKLKGGTS